MAPGTVGLAPRLFGPRGTKGLQGRPQHGEEDTARALASLLYGNVGLAGEEDRDNCALWNAHLSTLQIEKHPVVAYQAPFSGTLLLPLNYRQSHGDHQVCMRTGIGGHPPFMCICLGKDQEGR